MAWNQHQHRDRWAAGGTQLVVGTHFEKYARLGWSQQTECERDDTSSSWAFLPKQVVGVTPHATDGAAAAKPKGSVVRGKEQDENERVPNKPMQACRGRTNSSHRQNRSWDAAAVVHHPGIPSERTTASATPDALSSSRTWPVQGRSCSGEAAAGFELGEMDVELLVLHSWFLHRIPFGSTEQRETKPMLTRFRSESGERQWEQCNLSDCIPNPGRINKKPSQEGERDANSRQRVVSVTTSPQRKRLLPRAFPLRCAVTKDTETTRRRRKTGAIGSDIGEGDVQHVVDLASTSPDIRLQSKVSGHNQRWRKDTP